MLLYINAIRSVSRGLFFDKHFAAEKSNFRYDIGRILYNNFMFSDINLVAVVLAAVANMFLGAVWYSPPVFGKAWMNLAGITTEKVKDAEPHVWKYYLLGFINSVIMALVLAYLLVLTAASLTTGFFIAFLVWIGFVGTISMNTVMWGGRAKKLWFLDNAYYLLSFLIMSAFIFYMG